MKLSLVVPVYNEEEAIPVFYKAISSYVSLNAYELELIFVNDGSKDQTETLIYELARKDSRVVPLSFTRNFGKEAALMAGLSFATGDAVIPIDVDLQDPIEVIPELIERWEMGADVVLAKRIDRTTDSYLKRKTAEWFYKFNNKISDLKIEENVGDFRLLDRAIVDEIKNLPERNLFMKGILSWVGGTVDVVPYKRAERAAGKTKFNGWKLWNLALEGITNFSTVLLSYLVLYRNDHRCRSFAVWRLYDSLETSFWKPCSWVSVPHCIHLVHRRYPAYWDGAYGRVHRKNLFGDEETAEVCFKTQ